MAQKKKPANTMDSVFDFIFSEAKKTPDKVKPVKVTGLDATDPYVNIATAVLEQPLMYVNKTTENAIKGASDIELNTFNIDPDGKRKGRVKFSTSKIRDVLNNDLTFVDDAFTKLETARKSGRMTAFGTDVAAFTAAGMASQLGLDADTRNAFLKVGKSHDDKNAEYEMNVRSIHLAENSWSSGNYHLIPQADLELAYGQEAGRKVYDDLQSIHLKYQAEMAKPVGARDFSDVFNEAGNRNMHLLFEKATLAQKAAQARANAAGYAPGSAGAIRLYGQAKGYDDAQKILEVLHDSHKYEKTGGVSVYLTQKQADLTALRNQLQLLAGATSPASINRIREIGVEIRGINTQIRNFKLQNTAYNLGVMETHLQSIKQLWEYTVGGQFVPALLNGDFFNKKKNTAWGLQPRATEGDRKVKKLYYFDKHGNVVERKYEEFLAKEGKNPLQKAYYEGMMDFYYKFTPAGIVENLTTGKGFARQAFRQRENLIAAFQRGAGATFALPIDWEEVFGPNRVTYLAGLGADPRYAVFLQFINDNQDRFKRYNNLLITASRFNVIAGIKDEIVKNSLYKKTIGKWNKDLSKKLGDFLVKRMIKDEAAKKIVEEWAKNATLEGASVAIKAAIKSFLAGASGGVSAALGFVVDKAVDLAMRVAVKAAKPMIKFAISGFVFALIGIVGMAYLIFASPFKIMKTLGSYSHVAPHEIVLGDTDYVVDVGGGAEDGDDGLEEWEGGPPLPDGVSCLLGAGESYECTQGPGGGFSHSGLNAVDIGYGGVFYAPSFCGKGNCFIEYYGDFSCTAIGAGNAITLVAEYGGNTYKFIMYHVTLSSELSMGSQVSAGQAVGQILIAGTKSKCWTGPHLHLEVEYNGSRVNPYDVLTKNPDIGGFGCNITPCP